MAAGLVAIWEIGTRTGNLDKDFMSSPWLIATTIPHLLVDAEFVSALGTTGVQVLIAFGVGSASGIVIGTALGISKPLRDAYFGLLLFLLSTPKTVFLPIFLLLFGFGDASATAFGIFSSFFYVAVNVVSGVDLIEERHHRVVRAFNASRWQMFTSLVLPVALPSVVTGLWHGARHAVGGVLIAQLFIGLTGVGGLLKHYADTLNIDSMMTLIVIVAIASVLFGSMWTHIEARVSRWRESRPPVAESVSQLSA